MIGFWLRSIFHIRIISLLFLIFTSISIAFSFQTSLYPKREFRAVWIATVANLDWPLSRDSSAQQQQAELDTLFDQLKNIGFNAVIFQVRPECDAFYRSEFEPWSYWLTGEQGTPPDSSWDPLHYAIDAAHRRGMEFHAWFNPLRAERTVGAYPIAANHVVNSHPEWILTFNTAKILNPGLPEVRDYVVGIVSDVVRRYDIDGVHWDDYFYPYPPNSISHHDDSSYAVHNKDTLNRADWRRGNINALIKMVSDSIKAIKPWVKFGISPFGIWKTGIPEGISGRSGYDDIYCDAVFWMEHHYLDYLSPQLYWAIGGAQDYSKLLSWWNEHANGRYVFPGQAAYLINEKRWGASEILNQTRLNRTLSTPGNIYFRARAGIINNPDGCADSLKNDFYRYTALVPAMPWLDSIPPLPPMNLTATIDSSVVLLQWQEPLKAIDNDTSKCFVIYRSESPEPLNINDPRQIRMIIINDSMYWRDSTVFPGSQYTYAVSTLDKLNNESTIPAILTITVMVEKELPMVIDGLTLTQSEYFKKDFTISFTLHQSSYTKIKVRDVFGREVLTIVDGVLEEGMHSFNYVTELSEGIYLCTIVAGKYAEVKKMLVK